MHYGPMRTLRIRLLVEDFSYMRWGAHGGERADSPAPRIPAAYPKARRGMLWMLHPDPQRPVPTAQPPAHGRTFAPHLHRTGRGWSRMQLRMLRFHWREPAAAPPNE